MSSSSFTNPGALEGFSPIETCDNGSDDDNDYDVDCDDSDCGAVADDILENDGFVEGSGGSDDDCGCTVRRSSFTDASLLLAMLLAAELLFVRRRQS